MKLEKNARKVLDYLYKSYTKQHGSSMSNLGESYIILLDNGMQRAVPELYGADPKLRELKESVKELSTRGFIRVVGNYKGILLTKEGFVEASKTKWHRFVDFLNRNPGLAILISLISLIVAITALFNSWD